MLLGIRAKIRNGALLKWREERGLSQAKAAEVAGVSMTQWNAVECLRFSDDVSLDAVKRLAYCVDATIEELWPEELRGKRFETARTAYRTVNPDRLLSDVPRAKLLALPAPETEIDRPNEVDLKDAIDRALKKLTCREREIVKMRFGLVDGNQYTLEETGRVFKVTKDRIRQLEARALNKLGHPARGLRKLIGGA